MCGGFLVVFLFVCVCVLKHCLLLMSANLSVDILVVFFKIITISTLSPLI